MNTFKIDVTEQDIQNGIKKDCNKCPIALATVRVLPPNYTHIVVECDKIEASNRGVNCYFNLPHKARDFIERFDTDNIVSPISFEIKERSYEFNI